VDTVNTHAPKPKIAYGDNDEAAHEVLEYVQALPSPPRRFTPRPYNRFSPQFTDWWLIRGREWPAYPYSKLFFRRLRKDLYCGFYVEKGIGEQVAGVLGVKKTHCMGRSWYWHDFLRHAQAGRADAPIQTMRLNSGLPVVLHMDAYAANQVPEPDTEQQREPDQLEFEIQPGDGQLRVIHHQGVTLASLGVCIRLSVLAQALEANTELAFFWLDLYIGVRLEYGTRTQGSWDAAAIWHRVLEPWDSWVS